MDFETTIIKNSIYVVCYFSNIFFKIYYFPNYKKTWKEAENYKGLQG